MKVIVVPYDPSWPAKFQQEKLLILNVLGHYAVAIDHIGSTSIPNISAKPVIDILISVNDINEVDRFNADLTRLGYTARGEFGIVGRRFFVKDTNGQRSHQIHAFQVGNAELTKHLNFRDFMIAHPDYVTQYAQLKIELAQRFPDDVLSYSDGKNDFIKKIDILAKRWKSVGPLSVPKLSASPTKDFGDSGFHAILGEWDGGQYECKEVVKCRKQLAKAVRDSKERDNLCDVVKANIEALIIGGERIHGKFITEIRRSYLHYIDANAVRVNQAWLIFEAKLNQYPDIMGYIDQTVTEQEGRENNLSTLKDKFNFCLNKSQGNLRAFIQLERELDEAFNTYNQTAIEGFQLSNRINRDVINEYADYLGGSGNYLLPLELNLIAYVFNITVILYTRGLQDPKSSQLLDTYSPNAVKKVEVRFNGINHYERVITGQLQAQSAVLSVGLEGKEAQTTESKPAAFSYSSTSGLMGTFTSPVFLGNPASSAATPSAVSSSGANASTLPSPTVTTSKPKNDTPEPKL